MPPKAQPRQHGIDGAYVGGDWVPIEECGEKFPFAGKSCSRNCATCPRSQSLKSTVPVNGIYDVVVIGSGCIGGAIARELSKTNNHVILLEAADDVSQGATKGNSGIVHTGYDDKVGTNRAKYCWKGNQMFPQLDRELHFGYQKNGSLVLAHNKEEEGVLEELLRRGEANGVQNLRIINKHELFTLEPHVHPDCTAALLAPDAGNVTPYEFTIALVENAVMNGVELRIRREVTGIDIQKNGDETKDIFTIHARHWEPRNYIEATKKGSFFVPALISFLVVGVPLAILCSPGLRSMFETRFGLFNNIITPWLVAGFFTVGSAWWSALSKMGHSSGGKTDLPSLVGDASPSVGNNGRPVTLDEMKVGGSGSSSAVNGETVAMETYRARFVVNCAGLAADKIARFIGDSSIEIKPRLGDYLLLNRDQGYLTRHTLFPCPHPKYGKGVLVQTTLWGNLILGPTARDTDAYNESPESIQKYILSKCRQLVPGFDAKQSFHGFAGARAKATRGDWIIEPSAVNAQFIHVAGIDSPGLAASPAIALEVVRLLFEKGLPNTKNKSFNPIRNPLVVPKSSSLKGIKYGPVGKVQSPEENVICKCEKVTEAEVIAAVRSVLPVDSTQAVRKRTRAGMGHCQGDIENYNCEARVAAIIARELDIPISAVGRRPWPATTSFPQVTSFYFFIFLNCNMTGNGIWTNTICLLSTTNKMFTI